MRPPDPGRWRTGDGRVLLIAEMGTRHLQNAAAMLERRIARLDDALLAAASFHTDTMASYYARGEGDAACVSIGYLSAKKRELEEELRRRP